MDPLLVAITALAVSIAVIPLMIRLAPRLQLLDRPNARKVHVHPVPRVGGWGMCLGALIATVVWLQMDLVSTAFVIGGVILFIGGALDDMYDIPAFAKLLSQFVATLPAIAFAGLVVDTVPFFGQWNIPVMLAVPITWASLVLCINATNTSDGLDGLAAGATLLSLSGIIYLAYLIGSPKILILSAAALGGLIGFFRYNTHPAVIFMGDLGSQFLGFAIGFLGLALIQAAGGDVSPWSLLLIAGLPVADIAVVALGRILRGVSPFRADQTHLHHRLLKLGLSHNQSVALIYTLQAAFVAFGVLLHDAPAPRILGAYGLHLLAIYGSLAFAERKITARQRAIGFHAAARPTSSEPNPLLLWVPRLALEIVVPLLLVLAAFLIVDVPFDFGVLGLCTLIPLIFGISRKEPRSPFLVRIPVFLVSTALLYLYTSQWPFEAGLARSLEIFTFVLIGVLGFVGVRFSPKRRKEEFRANSMDYLLIVFTILAVVALRAIPTLFNPFFLIYLPILLYSCEFLMVERRQRVDWLPPAAIVAAATLAVRGLLMS